MEYPPIESKNSVKKLIFSTPKKYPAIEENIMLNDNLILVSCIKLTKKDKKLKEIVLDCSI